LGLEATSPGISPGCTACSESIGVSRVGVLNSVPATGDARVISGSSARIGGPDSDGEKSGGGVCTGGFCTGRGNGAFCGGRGNGALCGGRDTVAFRGGGGIDGGAAGKSCACIGGMLSTKPASGGGGTDAGCCDAGPELDTAERSGTRIGSVRPINGVSGAAGGTRPDGGDAGGADGGVDDTPARSGTRITRVFPNKAWAFGGGFAGGGTSGWGGRAVGGGATGLGTWGGGTDFVDPGFGMATVGSVE
jgi:hypothetical protein